MNFADYRRRREIASQRRTQMARREPFTNREQQVLYHLRLKTMEHRTLLAALKKGLPSDVLDEVIVDYAIRLRKAKSNFEKNNYRMEWELDEVESNGNVGD